MKRIFRVLILSGIAMLGTLSTGCLGGPGTVFSADPDAERDADGVVKTYRIVNVDSSGEHAYNLKTVIRMDALSGKASVDIYGDTALKVASVSGQIDTNISGMMFVYLWIEGGFGKLEPWSGPAIDRGVPSFARISPTGSAFEYQLTHTTLEKRKSDHIGTTTLLTRGLLRETSTERYQSIWEQDSKTSSTWSLRIRFQVAPTMPVTSCCFEKG